MAGKGVIVHGGQSNKHINTSDFSCQNFN